MIKLAKGFDWSEFFKIAGGVVLIGIGISVIGSSKGEISRIIIGFVFVGIGIALIANK